MFEDILQKFREERGILVNNKMMAIKISTVVRVLFGENLSAGTIIFHDYDNPAGYKSVQFILYNEFNTPVSYVVISGYPDQKLLMTTKTKTSGQIYYRYLNDDDRRIWQEMFGILDKMYGSKEAVKDKQE